MSPSDDVDAFEAVRALPDLTTRTFKTPAAGAASKPFKVRPSGDDGLLVSTSTGGQVALRAEALQAGLKAVADLGAVDPEGWIGVSDETLVAVLQSENRDKACSSYVLPLLEAAGLLELERKRPARVRTRRG